MLDIDKIFDVIRKVINDRESSYSAINLLQENFVTLINYAVENRNERSVHEEEAEASELIAAAISELGFEADINVGRDLWELVSEASQAQWLYPPETKEGVFISLVGVAENMAKSQCYINFT